MKHVLRVGWLVFWQEAERGNVRFSFFSPKSDLLGLTAGQPCPACSDAAAARCSRSEG